MAKDLRVKAFDILGSTLYAKIMLEVLTPTKYDAHQVQISCSQRLGLQKNALRVYVLGLRVSWRRVDWLSLALRLWKRHRAL